MLGTKLSVKISLLALGLSACTPHQQYRAKVDLCVSQTPTTAVECESHALQKYQQLAANPDYLMGFIELDDQGLIFDRQQVEAVVKAIYDAAINKDLLITVFMHGWQHNAAPGDDNIDTFRALLKSMSELEKQLSAHNQEPPRQVVGIYLSWRGRSITTPWLDQLSLWDRQNTANKIGEVGVGEILSRLERIKQDKDTIVAGGSHTRMAVIGHGLGGTAIYSALASTLKNRFIQTMAPEGAQGDVAGFGNIVILINPLISALQFATLSNMAAARSNYFGSQLPVLAILTSETDYATKMLFPLGRQFATLFETEREIKRWNAVIKKDEPLDEGVMNVTAVGHFPPYKTHYLYTTNEIPSNDLITSFDKIYRSWILDYPGSQIDFNGSVLERSGYSAGRNPYLVVRVNKDLIKDHSDIANERIQEFVKTLIMISSQTPKMVDKTRAEITASRH